jgi:hypothetical protein
MPDQTGDKGYQGTCQVLERVGPENGSREMAGCVCVRVCVCVCVSRLGRIENLHTGLELPYFYVLHLVTPGSGTPWANVSSPRK